MVYSTIRSEIRAEALLLSYIMSGIMSGITSGALSVNTLSSVFPGRSCGPLQALMFKISLHSIWFYSLCFVEAKPQLHSDVSLLS